MKYWRERVGGLKYSLELCKPTTGMAHMSPYTLLRSTANGIFLDKLATILPLILDIIQLTQIWMVHGV